MVRRHGLRPDYGLAARMTISLLLLAALYLLFIDVLLRAGFGYLPVAVMAGGMLLVQYYFSDQLVLLSTGARLLRPEQAPELYAAVEKLASLAGLPRPRLALIHTPMPNAFATGRNPQHAVVAVTTGLLDRLTPGEVEAVLAHELTHVKNRDMTVITMASFFATVASFIVQWSYYFFGWWGFGGDREERDNAALVYLVSLVVWLVSFFLIRALSRYREYAADRGSAILTGAPHLLASALIKISGTMSRIPNRDLRQAEALSALYIFPAISRGSIMELFATHPSLEHRLAYLRRLEEELRR